MPKALFALILVILFHATLASGRVRRARSPGCPAGYPFALTPEAPPEACRDCGLPYFRPSATPSEAVSDAQPDTPAPAASGAPSNALRLTSAGPAHGCTRAVAPVLRSRVNTARVLVERNRLPRPWLSCGPWLRTIRTRRTCGFSWAWPPAGGPRNPVEDEQRLALLDEAIAAFRSILIRQPGLVRVRLELALAFYLKEEDALARDHFDRALVGRPPAALVANINRFLNTMRARRRWQGYFGFSLAPDTNINAASDAEFIYINNLPFRRGQVGRPVPAIGVVGWGGGEYQYPAGRPLAPALGVQRQPPGIQGEPVRPDVRRGLRGAALADKPEYRDEPVGHREPALVGAAPASTMITARAWKWSTGSSRACG